MRGRRKAQCNGTPRMISLSTLKLVAHFTGLVTIFSDSPGSSEEAPTTISACMLCSTLSGASGAWRPCAHPMAATPNKSNPSWPLL